MIVTNTRLLRGQLFAVAAQLSRPDAWDERFALIVEGGQVVLVPVPAEQTSEAAAATP